MVFDSPLKPVDGERPTWTACLAVLSGERCAVVWFPAGMRLSEFRLNAKSYPETSA
jgi:hypothetical protein